MESRDGDRDRPGIPLKGVLKGLVFIHTKSVREPDGSVQAGNNMTLLVIQTNHSFLCGELEILGMRGLGWGQ